MIKKNNKLSDIIRINHPVLSYNDSIVWWSNWMKEQEILKKHQYKINKILEIKSKLK